jgi:hypothetical protein
MIPSSGVRFPSLTPIVFLIQNSFDIWREIMQKIGYPKFSVSATGPMCIYEPSKKCILVDNVEKVGFNECQICQLIQIKYILKEKVKMKRTAEKKKVSKKKDKWNDEWNDDWKDD